MDVAISRATEADLADIGGIAPAAYAPHYFEDWHDLLAFYRQLSTFGAEAMRAFLVRPDTRVWIARSDDGGGPAAIGFLTLIMGSLDPIDHRPGGAELQRIYMLTGATGG